MQRIVPGMLEYRIINGIHNRCLCRSGIGKVNSQQLPEAEYRPFIFNGGDQ